MGLIDKLLPSRRAAAFVMTDPSRISSPWSNTELTKIALAELTGVRNETVTRGDCMRVPAVVKARGLIVGQLMALPLTLWQDNTEIQAPRWFGSTKTGMSPRLRMAWTLDDLIFSGTSLWALERDPETDEITDAIRVEPANWSPDPDTRGVIVNGQPITDPRSIILFEGAQEGLVTLAAAEILGMLDMSNSWRQRVKSPVPLVELHINDANVELEDDEIDDMITDWEAARQAGGTAVTPAHIDTKMHGTGATDLFTEGRNASRLDVANYLMVPASLLEGSQSTSSLTYSTQEGRRNDFLDQCLTYWAGPIEARLSQDDVTPDGTSVRFNLAPLASPTQPTTNTSTED